MFPFTLISDMKMCRRTFFSHVRKIRRCGGMIIDTLCTFCPLVSHKLFLFYRSQKFSHIDVVQIIRAIKVGQSPDHVQECHKYFRPPDQRLEGKCEDIFNWKCNVENLVQYLSYLSNHISQYGVISNYTNHKPNCLEKWISWKWNFEIVNWTVPNL